MNEFCTALTIYTVCGVPAGFLKDQSQHSMFAPVDTVRVSLGRRLRLFVSDKEKTNNVI